MTRPIHRFFSHPQRATQYDYGLRISRRSVFSVLGLGAVPRVAFSDHGQTGAQVVRVGYFSKNLPTIIADVKQFWAAEGLSVELTQVTGSAAQANGLIKGEYDLAFCSVDNTANYHVNQHFDFQVIASQDLGGGLSLIARSEFGTVQSLAGARLSVDAVDSGFAFVLYKMLRMHGLERGRDYEVTPLGGTAQRFIALQNNTTDATLLSAGFEVRAQAAGFKKLMSIDQVSRPYLGSVIEGRQSWMEVHQESVIRFLRGYFRALQWSINPANYDEAVAILSTTVPGHSLEIAAAIYDAQVGHTNGLTSDMGINLPALSTVLALRQEFNGFPQLGPQQLGKMLSAEFGLWTDLYQRRALESSYLPIDW